jgi:hypothetical protein
MRTHANPLGRGLAQVYFQQKSPTMFGKKRLVLIDKCPFGSGSNLCLGSSTFLVVRLPVTQRLHPHYFSIQLSPLKAAQHRK